MANKKSISTAAAKAVARVIESPKFQGKWGTGEHLACLRYMTLDAMTEAKVPKELINAVNLKLREAFKADPELGYASNFQKLLVATGDLADTPEYE